MSGDTRSCGCSRGRPKYEWKRCPACGRLARIRRDRRSCSRACGHKLTGAALRAESPSYDVWHNRVKKARGSASDYRCIDCDGRAEDWSTADPSSDDVWVRFQPRCRKCHRRYDGAVGEGSPRAILTGKKVQELRARRANGLTYRQLADEFGISDVSAHAAVNRRTWAHVALPHQGGLMTSLPSRGTPRPKATESPVPCEAAAPSGVQAVLTGAASLTRERPAVRPATRTSRRSDSRDNRRSPRMPRTWGMRSSPQRAHCVVQRVSEQQERLRVRCRRERRQPRFWRCLEVRPSVQLLKLRDPLLRAPAILIPAQDVLPSRRCRLPVFPPHWVGMSAAGCSGYCDEPPFESSALGVGWPGSQGTEINVASEPSTLSGPAFGRELLSRSVDQDLLGGYGWGVLVRSFDGFAVDEGRAGAD
jgi:hypothetical protein